MPKKISNNSKDNLPDTASARLREWLKSNYNSSERDPKVTKIIETVIADFAKLS